MDKSGCVSYKRIAMPWYENAFFYHIYPMGFCGAPARNDFRSEPVERLAKIIDWIPHLADLGVTAVYLGPVFESVSHGYDTVDYNRVNRRLGTMNTLRRVVDRLHQRGIQVVLDGVFHQRVDGCFDCHSCWRTKR